MRTEQIITLGNAASGKTNFMACSMLYISRRMKETIKLNGNNKYFNNIIQRTNAEMKEGKWLPKTSATTNLDFQMREPNWLSMILGKWLAHQRQILLHDWMGEAFEALRDLDKWESPPFNLDPNLKNNFIKDVGDSQYFLIFLDANCLYNKDMASQINKCLNGLQELLEQSPGKKRYFACALSKSDMLEKIREYTQGDGSLNRGKIKNALEDRFDEFFSFLDWHEYPYEVYPVSCIPNKEHRRYDAQMGLVPNADWSVDDMQGQMEPFKWLISKFPWAII